MRFLYNKKTQKKIFIFLAAIIIPSFVLWGVLVSNEGVNTASALGTIDRKKISVRDYLASYKAARHEAMLLYGNRLSQIEPFLNFKGEAWDRLLLLHEAKKRKIKTSDKEVVQWLSAQPAFQENGRFNPELYKLIVARFLRADTRSFEEEIRQRLTIGKLQAGIIESITVTDGEIKKRHDQEEGERDIAYAVLPWESQKQAATPSEEELRKIYPFLKEELLSPEAVKIRYLFVPEAYETASQAILDDKETPFDELAEQHGLTVQSTDFFENNKAIPGIGLSKELLKWSFSLPGEGESPWVRHEKGFYKIKILEKREEKPLSFEEAREKLTETIQKQRAMDAALDKLNAVRGDLNAENFENTLKAKGFEVRTIPKFRRGTYLPSVGPATSVDTALLELKEGEVSDAVRIPSGAVLLCVLKDHPADPAGFEEKKENLREKVLLEKSKDVFQELITELRGRLTVNFDLMRDLFLEEDSN